MIKLTRAEAADILVRDRDCLTQAAASKILDDLVGFGLEFLPDDAIRPPPDERVDNSYHVLSGDANRVAALWSRGCWYFPRVAQPMTAEAAYGLYSYVRPIDLGDQP